MAYLNTECKYVLKYFYFFFYRTALFFTQSRIQQLDLDVLQLFFPVKKLITQGDKMSSEDEANITSRKKENKSKNEKISKSKRASKKKQNLVDTTNKNEQAESNGEDSPDDESLPKKQKIDENSSKNDKKKAESDENVSKSKKKDNFAKGKSPVRESARISAKSEESLKFSVGEKSPTKQSKKKVVAEKKEESESESESEISSEDEDQKKAKKKEKRTFTCFHCNESFLQTTELFMHTCSGKKEKGFMCEVCGKTFILRSSFINHKIIHSKKKPYKCTLCGKKSSQQSNHLYHMSREHPGEKPFSCLFFPCSKSFMTRMEQKKHHILHRKILCKYCDQSFADRPTMLKHRVSEHEQYFSDGKSKKSKKAEKEVAAESNNSASD